MRRCHLQIGRNRTFNKDWRATGNFYYAGKTDPIGGRDDHLIAFVDRCHQCVKEDLLAAGANRNLLGRHRNTVLALIFANNRRLQFGDTIDLSIAGVAVTHRLDCRLNNVRRRGKIRLAGSQTNDIASGGFHIQRHA